MRTLLDYQIWASGFYLTENIPPEVIDPDTSWDDFDAWIGEHLAYPFEEWDSGEVWELICDLANYTYVTMKFKESLDITVH